MPVLSLLPGPRLAPSTRTQNKSLPSASQPFPALTCCWEKGFLRDAIGFQSPFLPTAARQLGIGVLLPTRCLGPGTKQPADQFCTVITRPLPRTNAVGAGRDGCYAALRRCYPKVFHCQFYVFTVMAVRSSGCIKEKVPPSVWKKVIESTEPDVPVSQEKEKKQCLQCCQSSREK